MRISTVFSGRGTPGRRRGRMSAFLTPLATLFVAAAFALGCSDDSGGLGELSGEVQSPGPQLGGAVLEVTGKGITGFSGAGATRAFHSPTAVEDTYRVVLLSSATTGPLQFRVAVEDVSAGKPTVSLVNLTNSDNLPVPATSDYSVTFTR